MTRSVKWVLIPVGFLSVLVCCPISWPFEIVFSLMVGWALFFIRTVQAMQIDWGGTATALIALVGLILGLHWFLRWLFSQMSASNADSPPRHWHFGWTASILGMVVLMFVAGTAAVGVTHQSIWLFTSSEKLVEGSMRDLAGQTASRSNLRQVATAAHMFHDNTKSLPPGALYSQQGVALHGWQTMLLPYLEEHKLYERINLDLPWNAPSNKPHFAKLINPYQSNFADTTHDPAGYALSHYASNVRVLGGGPALKLGQIADGTSNTILLGEAAGNYRPWGHPANWRDPALGINTTLDGFGNPRKNGTVFVFADASVHFISQDISPSVLKALSTPNGGETIKPGDWDGD